jgi:hypothetical protein
MALQTYEGTLKRCGVVSAFSANKECKEVKESDEMEVDSLLLGFSDLSEAQQAVFLEGLNRYLFVSPSRRRQLRLRWKKSRQLSEERFTEGGRGS